MENVVILTPDGRGLSPYREFKKLYLICNCSYFNIWDIDSNRNNTKSMNQLHDEIKKSYPYIRDLKNLHLIPVIGLKIQEHIVESKKIPENKRVFILPEDREELKKFSDVILSLHEYKRKSKYNKFKFLDFNIEF